MIYLDPITDKPTTPKLADSSVGCSFYSALNFNTTNLSLFMHIGQEVTIKNYRGPDAVFAFYTPKIPQVPSRGYRLFDSNGVDIAPNQEGLVQARTDGDTGSATGVTVTYLPVFTWNLSDPSLTAGDQASTLRRAENEAIGAVGFGGFGTRLEYRLTSTQLYY